MSDPEPLPDVSPPAAPRAPEPPRPRPRPARRPLPIGVLLLLAGVVGGGCLLLGLVATLGGGGGGALAAAGGGGLVEETIQGQGDGKVVLIELDGVIARVQSTGMFGGGVDLVERLRKELEAAKADTQVVALLLSIDSPGGTVTASDEIWHMIQQWKRDTGKPVVVHMGSLCASGGYYIAVSADEIICEPTTITGSIGVILQGMNFHDLMTKYGVRDVTITSGPNKDLLSSTADPDAPQRALHRPILQAMVDESYERFITLVQQGRARTGLTLDEVRELADGRIYTAQQALDKKLVDKLGYREDALAAALTRAGRVSARLVRYTRPPTLADLLGGAARFTGAVEGLSQGPSVDPALLDRLGTPRLMALWQGAR